MQARGEYRELGKRDIPKEHSKLLVTEHEDMEIHALPGKKIKNNFSEDSQRATREYKQFNKIRQTIQEQNEKFNKKILKNIKNPRNFGDEERIQTELKSSVESFNNVLNQNKRESASSKISHLKLFPQRSKKQQQQKRNEKRKEGSPWDLLGTIKRNSLHIPGVPEREGGRKGQKVYWKK